ncbi:hypothetical protein K470DRAFT_270193 [Piedraia hortae CBS 480.64]|uniref:SKP1 component POZ domain-containing protein n=1 Tax=Piedraia hortae CBS 480.64 TaxID=1314780 RepID=A0A6A7C0D1_9PEZI|nr:hypothetical protein K470DRAFT_270193 [Piedraia hortae CBS 480.64]
MLASRSSLSSPGDHIVYICAGDGVPIPICRRVAERIRSMRRMGNYFVESEGPILIGRRPRAVRNIIEWCEHHEHDALPTTDINHGRLQISLLEWDKVFFADLDLYAYST